MLSNISIIIKFVASVPAYLAYLRKSLATQK
jgi:hypothetical protein